VAAGFDQSGVGFDSTLYTFDGTSLVVDVADPTPDLFEVRRAATVDIDR
jgi:hypothetical protein